MFWPYGKKVLELMEDLVIPDSHNSVMERNTVSERLLATIAATPTISTRSLKKEKLSVIKKPSSVIKKTSSAKAPLPRYMTNDWLYIAQKYRAKRFKLETGHMATRSNEGKGEKGTLNLADREVANWPFLATWPSNPTVKPWCGINWD